MENERTLLGLFLKDQMFKHIFNQPPPPVPQRPINVIDVSKYFHVDRATLLKDIAVELEDLTSRQQNDFSYITSGQRIVLDVKEKRLDTEHSTVFITFLMNLDISRIIDLVNPSNQILTVLSEDDRMEFSLQRVGTPQGYGNHHFSMSMPTPDNRFFTPMPPFPSFIFKAKKL